MAATTRTGVTDSSEDQEGGTVGVETNELIFKDVKDVYEELANCAVVSSVPGEELIGVNSETVSEKEFGKYRVGIDKGIVGAGAPVGLLLHRGRHGELGDCMTERLMLTECSVYCVAEIDGA